MNHLGTRLLLLAAPGLLATSALANYSPDWQHYRLNGESSRQLGDRLTEVTYELSASDAGVPYQQLRVYRRFDWQATKLDALAEQQCGEPQLRVEQGWQIRYRSCEQVVPVGKVVPASSYDFGYGLKQGRWEPLAGTPTAPRQDTLPLPERLVLGHSEQELDRCELNAQGRCAEQSWQYRPQDWQQLSVLEETPNERDGRLEQIFFRLQPVAGSLAASQVRELHVWRQYSWLLDEARAQQECDQPQTRQEGDKTISYRICRQTLPAGSEVQVVLKDSGYQYPVGGNEWQALPDTPEWQESRVLNRPIVLASVEEQLDCRRADGRACSEPEQPGTDLLDAEAARIVQDASGQPAPVWQENYGHDDRKLLAVSRGIQSLLAANQPTHPAMKLLLEYVRAHNYHNHGKHREDGTAAAEALAEALTALGAHPLLYPAQANDEVGTVIGAWSIALHGQFRSPAVQSRFGALLAEFNQMLAYSSRHASEINGRHAWATGLFDLLNFLDFASDYAEPFANDFRQQDGELRQQLHALGMSELALWKGREGADLFLLNNVLDAYTRLYRIARYTRPDESEGYRTLLDDAVIAQIRHHGLIPGGAQNPALLEDMSLTLSTYYLTYTDRTAEACISGDFAGLCTPIRMEDVLPFEHTCSPTLRLRAQDLSQDQASNICRELGAEEEQFHRQLETGGQPVADDHNEALELVIFDSSADWKRYGSALFGGVSTDNGGIYIEGDPARPGNQARFFAYEAEWKRPAFQVWNLRHEYVHYLDGRFNQYGSFGHYPLNRTTWWSEGLAEFVAHGQCFARGLDNVTARPAGERPSLADILHLDYDKGGEMVYSWSYTVHRFLNETGRGASWLAMAEALRNPDQGQAMGAFEAELDQLITGDSEAYQQWLAGELLPWWESNKASDACKGNDSAH
ncbi:collagenase [Aeromonas sp. MR16]|uniref:collagenase n=1 Tax=Aeromonas sp. MR16 TaxID=2923420 RepID=UPI001F4B2A2C|nr:collagenase [Aeromonas sp. MR16]MCH7370876.1 collagenase [Aeromonas sp. MR16]